MRDRLGVISWKHPKLRIRDHSIWSTIPQKVRGDSSTLGYKGRKGHS